MGWGFHVALTDQVNNLTMHGSGEGKTAYVYRLLPKNPSLRSASFSIDPLFQNGLQLLKGTPSAYHDHVTKAGAPQQEKVLRSGKRCAVDVNRPPKKQKALIPYFANGQKPDQLHSSAPQWLH